jgi:hypothetical protein
MENIVINTGEEKRYLMGEICKLHKEGFLDDNEWEKSRGYLYTIKGKEGKVIPECASRGEYTEDEIRSLNKKALSIVIRSKE